MLTGCVRGRRNVHSIGERLNRNTGRRLTEEQHRTDQASSDAAVRARALEAENLVLRNAKHAAEGRAAELARRMEEAGRSREALQGIEV